MVDLKVGDVINIDDHKSGESKGGFYFMVSVAGERGTDKLSLFCDNPQEVANFRSHRAKVKNISGVQKSAFKNAKDQWTPSFKVFATLEEVVGLSTDELMAVDDSELPFN